MHPLNIKTIKTSFISYFPSNLNKYPSLQLLQILLLLINSQSLHSLKSTSSEQLKHSLFLSYSPSPHYSTHSTDKLFELGIFAPLTKNKLLFIFVVTHNSNYIHYSLFSYNFLVELIYNLQHIPFNRSLN